MSLESIAVDDSADDPKVVGAGTVLEDRYELVELVGEGGMGRVYLAHDREAGVDVAVKVLTDDRPIPRAAARFEREARSIARIEHDNVVRVSHVGQSPHGGLYYVMEYLDGEELADTLAREGRMPWNRVRHIGMQICAALHAAHEQGVVHRDLKLENCFRVDRDDDEDFVKILDFGVAKLLRPDEEEDRLTNTGATLGTPAYMAPELCRGKAIDHRVDVYALGVMLYELLTGTLPFEGESFLDVALKHMHEPPPPLSDHLPPEAVPRGLQAVIDRALAKAREDRFPTMSAFGRALDQLGRTRPAMALPFSREDREPPIVGRGGTVPTLDAWDPSLTGRTVLTPPDDASASMDEQPVVLPRSPASLWWGVFVASMVVAVVAALATWWLTRKEPQAAADPPPEQVETVQTIEPRVGADGAAMAGSTGAPEPAEISEGAAADESASAEAELEITDTSEADPEPKVRRRQGLGRAQIDEGLRSVRARIRTCVGGATGGKPGDRVGVKLEVDRAKGTVISVEATAKAGTTTAVEGCVKQAMLRARFDSTGQGVQRVSRTITL